MPTIYDLWAKTNERDGKDRDPWRRHAFPLHLLDVALVAEAWLEKDTGLFRRFCELWPDAEPDAIRRALVLTAAAHDLMKVHVEFQAKSEEGWRRGYGATWSQPSRPDGTGFDHGRATGEVFLSMVSDDGWLPDGVSSGWAPLLPLLCAASGHHGTLYHDVTPDTGIGWRVRNQAWAPLVVDALDEVIHHLGKPLPLPEGSPPAFLLLTAGFVSVADWFGSNTESFPLAGEAVTTREAAEAYLAEHRERETAETALADAGLIAGFSEVPGAFGKLFRDEPSDDDEGWTPRLGFQEVVCDLDQLDFGVTPGPEIAIVEAQMGVGKTEVALWLAASALRHKTANGLYDALPTQATANAAFERVRQFATRLRPDSDLALALVHGAKRFDDAYSRLRRAYGAGTHRSAGDEAVPSEVVAPSWLQPSKRALLAPVGVGTIDQALLGVMGVRHGFVRLFALARKVVVIDEVHAYDAYTGTLLRHLLRWLGALGTKVVLLSATLPPSLRTTLLDAYFQNATPTGSVPDGTAGEPDAYPRLVHARPGARAAVLTDPRPEAERETTRVFVERVLPDESVPDDKIDPRTRAGVAWVGERVEQGGCVAWIRNTVREAQEAYATLKGAGVPAILLHARFARFDRNRIEADLLARLGPLGTDRPDRLVVVATQVIEQSVDLDFDAMLSDLAPVDLLLQRAGRLWRHERPGERHGHTRPVLGVLMPSDADLSALAFGSSRYVYDAETLARSAVLVRQHDAWTLPAACRSLVSDLYDGDWSGRLPVDPDSLVKAQKALQAQTRRMEHAARQAFLSSPDRHPAVRDARRDQSDAGAFATLTTRYGAHTAAAALFRDTPAGPVPVGADAPLAVPAAGNGAARFSAEEAVELASVSFPWYGDRPDDTAVSDSLDGLRAWWRETRPYDDRLFVLLREGGFVHGQVIGRYSPVTGLHLARPSDSPSDAPPFESL